MGTCLGQTERHPSVPERKDEDFDVLRLWKKHAEAFEKLANVVTETGFLKDPRGVVVAEALSTTDFDFGHVEYYQRSDGLWDAFNGYHMGTTAEHISKRFEIGRDLQKRAASLPDLPVPLGYGEADRAEGALAAE